MGIIHSSPIILTNKISPVSDDENDMTKLKIRIPRHPTCNECGKFSSIAELEEKGHYIYWYPIYCSYVHDPKCFGELVIN